jgi:hypothetical protein
LTKLQTVEDYNNTKNVKLITLTAILLHFYFREQHFAVIFSRGTYYAQPTAS